MPPYPNQTGAYYPDYAYGYPAYSYPAYPYYYVLSLLL